MTVGSPIPGLQWPSGAAAPRMPRSISKSQPPSGPRRPVTSGRRSMIPEVGAVGKPAPTPSDDESPQSGAVPSSIRASPGGEVAPGLDPAGGPGDFQAVDPVGLARGRGGPGGRRRTGSCPPPARARTSVRPPTVARTFAPTAGPRARAAGRPVRGSSDRPPAVTLRSTAAGASRALTTASSRPSPSRSPTARPRPRIGRANQGPAVGGGVDEPAADVAEQGRPHRERLAEPGPVEDVAVGLDQVEPAVGVEVGQGHAEAQDRPGRAARPRASEASANAPPPRRPEADRRPAQEVAHDQVGPAVAVEVAERHAHPGQGLAPAVEGDARRRARPPRTGARPGSRTASRRSRRWPRRCRGRGSPDEVGHEHAQPSAARAGRSRRPSRRRRTCRRRRSDRAGRAGRRTPRGRSSRAGRRARRRRGRGPGRSRGRWRRRGRGRRRRRGRRTRPRCSRGPSRPRPASVTSSNRPPPAFR